MIPRALFTSDRQYLWQFCKTAIPIPLAKEQPGHREATCPAPSPRTRAPVLPLCRISLLQRLIQALGCQLCMIHPTLKRNCNRIKDTFPIRTGLSPSPPHQSSALLPWLTASAPRAPGWGRSGHVQLASRRMLLAQMVQLGSGHFCENDPHRQEITK